MTPYYAGAGVELYVGDARDVLPTLPSDSVQCCVTSPPFFGLRDYGTATWEGGDGECDHVQSRALKRDTNGGMLPAGQGTRGTQSSTASSVLLYRDNCGRCGAQRIDRQIGLEQAPTDYVAALVEVFREVRRVLRSDGVLWLEIGDSYAGAGYSNHANTGGAQREDGGKQHHTLGTGLKPKDLIGIPWRVAFALQADGWYLRADVIWARPNPMPESVRDRPTKAHSYLFLLSKSQTYFYNADAIAERAVRGDASAGTRNYRPTTDGNQRKDCGQIVDNERTVRNKRSVWTVNPAQFPEAHFATYPPALIRPCILAGSREGDTVLDPFGGAGTTLMVAQHLARRAVGIELNPTYADLAIRRLLQPAMALESA